jgi:hypothetical protein
VDLRRLGWTRPQNPPAKHKPPIDSNKKPMDVQPPIQPPKDKTPALKIDSPHATASPEIPRPAVVQTATVIRKPDATHVMHNPQLSQLESVLPHLTKSNLKLLEPKTVSSKDTAPSAMSHSMPPNTWITVRLPQKPVPPPKLDPPAKSAWTNGPPKSTVSPVQRTDNKISTSSTPSPVRLVNNSSRTSPPKSKPPKAKSPEGLWDVNIHGASPPAHVIYNATGRGKSQPTRQPPINSQQKVTEWQLSARGNPQLASYPPTNSEFTPVQEKSPADLLQANFDVPVPTKPVDPKFSVFDDLALLIPIDEVEVNVVANDIVQEIALPEFIVQESVEEEDFMLADIMQESAVKESVVENVVDEMSSGDTITEEDTSILAEFADAFYAGHGYEGLEYGCLSDSSTDFDWQDEKEIEYEGGEVDHLVGGAVDVPVGSYELGRKEDELGCEEDIIRLNIASSSTVSVEIWFDAEQFEGVLADSSSPAALPPGTDTVEETDAKSGQSETLPEEPRPENPAEDTQSQDQLVSTEDFIPTKYSENRQMPAPLSDEEQSTPAAPFAKIFAAAHEQTQSQETAQPSKGNNLRDFILRSGLFSIA